MNDRKVIMKGDKNTSVKHMVITKVAGLQATAVSDVLAVEEPLQISVLIDAEDGRVQKNISVTMRTPGNDAELAIGFLFTEGIIHSYNNIAKINCAEEGSTFDPKNIIRIDFIKNFAPLLNQTDRNFYTTSSCGVCGKGSIESIKTVSQFSNIGNPQLQLNTDVLYHLPQKLKHQQNNFSATGGIHASGLFSFDGELLLLREDVGRHNALDKLIGAALTNHLLPLNQHILMLSGRASFELIQKASMAGITIVVAIGAPSSLAVDLAKEYDITLLGFLKENRFNIYNLSTYISIPALYENKD